MTAFEARFADDRGAGLRGLHVRIVTRERSATVLTDAEGFARLPGTPGSVAGVSAQPDEVGAALEADGEPTSAAPPLAGAAASSVVLREARLADAWTAVRAGEPATIVFRREAARLDIGAAPFEPEVSFIPPTVVAALAPVREALAADPRRKLVLLGIAPDRAEEGALEAPRRRAEAIHALLTHRPEVWERLYQIEKWNLRAGIFRTILEALGYRVGPANVSIRPALEAFQRDHPPLPQDGTLGPEVRRALFEKYFRLAAEVPVPAERFGDAPHVRAPFAAVRGSAPDVAVAAFFFEGRHPPRLACAVEVGEGDGCSCLIEYDIRVQKDRWSQGQEVAFAALDRQTGRSLARVPFSVETSEAGVVARGETDASGRARAVVPSPGAYRVRASFRAPTGESAWSPPAPASAPAPAPAPAPALAPAPAPPPAPAPSPPPPPPAPARAVVSAPAPAPAPAPALDWDDDDDLPDLEPPPPDLEPPSEDDDL